MVDENKILDIIEATQRGASEKGALAQKRIEEMSKDPMKYNKDLLLKIIEDNKDTEFGRKYNFSEIKTIEDYKKNVPLSKYDDYSEYIYRMTEKSEENLITSYPIVYYAKSSGTMGDPKRIPVSERSVMKVSEYLQTLRTKQITDKIGTDWYRGKLFSIVELTTSMLNCNKPYGPISGCMLNSLGENLKYFVTSPEEALYPDLKSDVNYINARFALQCKDITMHSSSYISRTLEIMRYIDKNWKILVDDIEKGTINEEVNLSDEVRSSVSKKISPMPERAKELREVFENNSDEPLMKRLWPRLEVIASIATGGFASYLEKLDKYRGDIKIYYLGLSASEGMFTIPIELDNDDAIAIPDSMFYEFLPLDAEDGDDTLTLDQLEVGKLYEIITTNLNGFYRYKMGDAVKVKGLYNNMPILEFSHRINQTLNLYGEKTSEAVLRKALDEVGKRHNVNIVDFSGYEDITDEFSRYGLFIELEEKPKNISIEKLGKEMDCAIADINPIYGVKINANIISPLNLQVVQPETYILFREMMIQRGAPPAQVKPPHMIKNEMHKIFFRALLDE